LAPAAVDTGYGIGWISTGGWLGAGGGNEDAPAELVDNDNFTRRVLL